MRCESCASSHIMRNASKYPPIIHQHVCGVKACFYVAPCYLAIPSTGRPGPATIWNGPLAIDIPRAVQCSSPDGLYRAAKDGALPLEIITFSHYLPARTLNAWIVCKRTDKITYK